MKILRLWGIPIHKVLSDTEFVEKTRKGLRLSKKLVWIHVAAMLVVCVIVPMMVKIAWDLGQESSGEERRGLWLGLLAGFFFGAFIGQYVLMGLQAILVALDLYDTNRATRLLIKYHDMLQEMGVLEEEIPLQNGRIWAD